MLESKIFHFWFQWRLCYLTLWLWDAGVFMDRSTMGLYQVMGDPNLTFKQNIVLSGELSVYTDKEGKKRAAFGRVSLFAKAHNKDSQ